MIRVTIEMIPGGAETHPRRRVMGVVEIANVGGSADSGNYSFTLDKSLFDKPGQTWRRGVVANFPRRRLGPYDLLFRCLRVAVGERNKL